MSGELAKLWERNLRHPLDDALSEQLSAELKMAIRSFDHGPDRVLGQRAISLSEDGLAFLAIEQDGLETPVVRLFGRDADRARLMNTWEETETAISRAESASWPDGGPHGTPIWAPFLWPGEPALDRALPDLGVGLAILVESLEAAMELAAGNRGELLTDVAPLFGGQGAIVTDPAGNRVLLWERSLDDRNSEFKRADLARVDVTSPNPRPLAHFYRVVAGWRTAVIKGEPIEALLTHRGNTIGVLSQDPTESRLEVLPSLAGAISELMLERPSWNLLPPLERGAVVAVQAALDLLASNLRDPGLTALRRPREYRIATIATTLSSALDPAVDRVIDLVDEPADEPGALVQALTELRLKVAGLVGPLGATVASLDDEALDLAYSQTRARLVRAALLRDDATGRREQSSD